MKVKKTLMKALKNRSGFTLIEMLIVVAIIAILVAVSIPMVNSNLEKARNSADMANVRAAKAWATMDYMQGSDAKIVKGFAAAVEGSAKTVKVWYNAASGECVASSGTKPKGYGKSTKEIPDSTAATFGAEIPKNLTIALTIGEDGKVTEVKWE